MRQEKSMCHWMSENGKLCARRITYEPAHNKIITRAVVLRKAHSQLLDISMRYAAYTRNA